LFGLILAAYQFIVVHNRRVGLMENYLFDGDEIKELRTFCEV